MFESIACDGPLIFEHRTDLVVYNICVSLVAAWLHFHTSVLFLPVSAHIALGL